MFNVFAIVLAYVQIFVFVLWWSIVIIVFAQKALLVSGARPGPVIELAFGQLVNAISVS